MSHVSSSCTKATVQFHRTIENTDHTCCENSDLFHTILNTVMWNQVYKQKTKKRFCQVVIKLQGNFNRVEYFIEYLTFVIISTWQQREYVVSQKKILKVSQISSGWIVLQLEN